ncbi:MAG: O-antigen ligase family protein [Candidatus Sulfotelmatobacter sp.]|jgi:O-antigen ligase
MRVPLRLVLALLAVAAVGVLFLYVERRPLLFANVTYMGAILVLEVVAACLWRFEKFFFPMTMGCFFLAATGLPLAGESLTIRWLFLGVGALVGLSFWMRTNREKHFEVFHLVALFCVFSAIASASASAAARVGLLKAGSLFLLFLYAATGGRVAMAGRERTFVRGLVLGSEIVVFFVSACYFVGYNFFGNPNNLGAFVGVIVTPVLLWAALTAEDRSERQRSYTALALCGILLYVTVCRAAIIADVVITIALTIALRHPRLLIRAAFAGALFLEIMAVANPSRMGELMDSMSGRFVFKTGRPGQAGVFGSREAPWDSTMAAVKQHPWFGTGFGTSDLGSEQTGMRESSIYTVEGSNREHGSSYLAMAEYMGLLGIVPFLLLLLLVIRATTRIFVWMRRTGSPNHYGVPFALIALAGLIHAGFEDWLFATGSYLCVFFWVSAFLLVDLAAAARTEMQRAPQPVPRFAPAAGFSRSTTSI